ncbi:MAG: restriction endonuclease [Planctomycetes bacterium]|nr:restriction endonuclease [Planctomycetota bacterium]
MGVGLYGSLLFYPDDSALADFKQAAEAARKDAERTYRIACDDARSQKVQLENARADLKVATGELLALKNSVAVQQETRLSELLKSDWKALRSEEFEKFLEKVFCELGYVVELTKVTGDQGVDLILSARGKRIAIQVKGYFNSVSNSAVQEAHAGKAFYGCDSCAVVTNSRFTPSAVELAERIGCILIDEETLPQIIMQKLDLWDLCFVKHG